jgi:ATP-dependent DNA helicase RecQ
MSGSPLEVLRSVFGYSAFRGEQAAVVDHVVGGGDALVLMPTGGGKSLCYQVPSLVRDGVGVVVSPLIALMKDQVDALRELGVRAAAINSTLPWEEAQALEARMQRGELDVVYVAPERLVTERFLSVLDRTPLALFAIDEAHCVSQWGHDFREDYLGLAVLATRFPGVPRIALTATADKATRAEVVERLSLQGARVFLSSFDRPNIRYRVVERDNPRAQLLAFLRASHPGESGIVYCLSRKKVEETAEWLAGQGVPALPYHAGLDASVREENQERFLKEEGLVMVATVAFGMGIDKPDVRFVAHLGLPKSLEGYYQETGRAGRDGLPSDAWLTYGLQDAVEVRQLLGRSEAAESFRRLESRRFDTLLAYCETARCRREVLLAAFDEHFQGPCNNCDTCLEPVTTWDGTVAAQKMLSNVHRTGQRFGAGHLVEVLLGRDTEKVRSFGHHALSTFGIGTELDERGWRSVVRQLVALGLLEADQHGGLALTRKARPVLRGEEKLLLRRDPPAAAPARRARGASGRGGGAGGTSASTADVDPALWEALRTCRRELARAQGVPPYVIFNDATLAQMARERPQSLPALRRVSGVGDVKLERFGAAFLAVLRGEDPSLTGS